MKYGPNQHQPPLTEEQRSLASSIELAKQQNAKNLDKAVLMIELRKWCVDEALKGCNSDISAPAFVLDNSGGREPARVEFAAVALAREILAFVSAPLQE